ncbi:NAD-dependent epimerase/dehydratase family protein [Candidatus Pelagibacter communis]|uniref:NAD-dependent epimerase/dehydratase family protein n=1 Tax=Pelagibacter ubique TaxID=198252 RepID=UPI00094DA1B2|nr:NAD-dependent epimerase/dehydratase family protein [Candidatus Pelagibacter ubique]
MKNKNVLLVGGCGFIGHNLALKLVEKNYNVSIVDSLAVNNLLSFTDNSIVNKNLYRSILNNRIKLLNNKKVNLFIEDARNYHAISKLYENINPSIIIHLAAVSHANKSNKDPHSTFDHSLRTLENTLDFSKDKKTHVIYMSSSMVYGDFKSESVNEDETCKPIGIYGSLKYSGEIILKSYNKVFDLPYTIIRPSALYGERCVSRRVGQVFIESALQNQKISINGDGNDKLDFTYIDDLVQGIMLCCENEKARNETFNITYGNARKISELLSILKSEFKDVEVSYVPKEKFVPERGTLNISKAKKLLGYKPSYSIDTGYKKYIEWYKNFYKSALINE